MTLGRFEQNRKVKFNYEQLYEGIELIFHLIMLFGSFIEQLK